MILANKFWKFYGSMIINTNLENVVGLVGHMRDTGMSLNMTRAGVTRDEE